MAGYKIISADSHANEPNEVYQRVPAEYRDRAPRIEEIDGVRYNIFEGQSPFPVEAPNPLTEDDMHRYWREGEEVGRVMHRAGGIDIPLRLADQDVDGVSAEVIYPQAIFKVFASPDPGYQKAFARVYNDWYEEVFGGYPDRWVVSAVIPMVNVDDAVEEAKRVARMGYRSLSVPVAMPALPYNYPEYEPFWATAEELGIPVAFHVATQGPSPIPENTEPEKYGPGQDLADTTRILLSAFGPLTLITAAGVLDRHPNMKFVLVECGIGWIAWVLQTMDEMVQKRHMWVEPKLGLLPSEYFRRQGYATFGDDAVGLRNRDITGVETLMWGNDYPHDEGTFPHSREVIERLFTDVPEDEKRKIVAENAAGLYGFPLD
ncbi:MAG: amidohydrolase family protein [Dehalococcoidia bacterium]